VPLRTTRSIQHETLGLFLHMRSCRSQGEGPIGATRGFRFYGQHEEWRRITRSTIALNGPYFNTQRMLAQYVLKA
jgi:hypothetical protein